MGVKRSLVTLVASLCLLTCISASISEEGNLCVTVNVTTEEASYTCTSEQDLILWRVGSRQIAGTVVEVNGVEVNTTTLPGEGYSSTIVFTPTFLEDMADGSEIEVACLVQRGLFQIVEADTRTLVVFTSPPPPENLRVVPTSTPLVYDVVWTKPASVNPCPDVVYQVTVTNNVTGEVEVEAEGAIRESITFNDTDSVMCQLHEFEVKTLVGEAFSSPTIERVALPLSPSVERINARATPILGEDEILIELVFEPATTCDEVTYPILNYMITIPGLSFTMTLPHTGEGVALNLSSPDFTMANYSIIISACASFGCRSADPLTLLTNEVQSATITFLNTTVSLTCVFTATGSATACRFTLTLASGDSETLDIPRPQGGGLVQMCATTQNNREAYISVVVQSIDRDGVPEGLRLEPVVNETQDLQEIAPCEPPPPEVITDVVEKSTLSDGEIAAIIIVVIVLSLLLVIALIGIVVWKRQTISSAYKNWVHPLTEEEGIDLMIEERPVATPTDKPTIMMLMNNLVPGKGSTTTTMTAVTAAKKKTVSFYLTTLLYYFGSGVYVCIMYLNAPCHSLFCS
jgi:hypothetical protein